MQPAVVTAELFDEHEIPEFHDGPRSSASKRMVNFVLADWLLKGNAGERFRVSRDRRDPQQIQR
jgi:hypothetical protein